MKTMTREEVQISTVGDIELLKDRHWTDDLIRKIATEDVARLAYDQSPMLQQEFTSPGAFVGYWNALREGRVGIIRSRS